MKYKRLRIANYRGVDCLEVDFVADGITLVQGPNEIGKTSLSEAIGILFDFPDNAKRKQTIAIRPAHRDAGSEIELEAESGPYEFIYAKRFHKKPETRLTIKTPKPESHTGREAHDRALEILTETLDIDLWKALTIQQGEGISQPNLKDKQSLSAALDKAAGGTPTEPAEEGLFDKVANEYSRYYSLKTDKENKELTGAFNRKQSAEEEVHQIEEKLRALDEDIDKAARLEKSLASLVQREAQLTKDLETHGQTLKEIEDLETAVREATLKLESADNALKLAEKNKNERHDLIESIKVTRKEYEQLVEKSGEWMPKLNQAEAQLKSAETTYKNANQKRKVADSLARIRRADLDYYNDLLFLEQFRERKTRIDAARKAAAHADETIKNNQVDDDVLKRIEIAERELLAAESRRDIGAPSLKLIGLSECRVRIDNEESVIQTDEVQEIAVSDRKQIVIPDQLEIEVAAGTSIDELARKVTHAKAALDSACREAGVADPDSARIAFEARKSASALIADREKVEAEALRDLSYDELANRLLHLEETVPTYIANRQANPPIAPDLDVATTLRTNAESDLEECDSELEIASQQVSLRQEFREQLNRECETDRVKLASCEKNLHQQTARLESARGVISGQALEQEWQQAKTAVTTEGSKVRDAEKSLQAKNPEQVKAIELSTRGSLDTAKKQRETDQRELTQVQERLKINGEDGLHEKLQTAETSSQRSTAEYDSLARQASAAKLLYEIMKQERDKARQAYVAPLKERVEALARIVFDQDVQIELHEENLEIVKRTCNGVTVEFDWLSGGAKEQLSLIFRLACSMIVAKEGGMPLIMDDALGYTDPERLKAMGAVLARAAKECQIVILTCMPDRYSHIGEATVVSL